ncbi:hypothetical protein Tco_0155738 [Tanacetum coccineum]
MGTLREIVEEARIEKPLDNALEYACLYTKQSQELLEYVIGTCLKELRVNSSTAASGSKPRSNTKTNRIFFCEEKWRLLEIAPSGKTNRILPAKSDNNKKVEDHPRTNKSSLKKSNFAIEILKVNSEKHSCYGRDVDSMELFKRRWISSQKTGKTQAKMTKTEHGMEKTVQNQGHESKNGKVRVQY